MAPRTPPGHTRGQIFHYVRQRLLEGQPPTVRDVQRTFGFRSVQTAREHLETLVAEGKLAKEPGQSRGYRLPTPGSARPPSFVPLVGRVQAGALTTAIEEPEGYITVDSHNEGDGLFALRVRGESMRDAGILPGDVVVVRRQNTAQTGEIVVALVGDEATVKRFKIQNGRVELVPANPDFQTIALGADEVVVLGKVVELRRYLERPPRVSD